MASHWEQLPLRVDNFRSGLVYKKAKKKKKKKNEKNGSHRSILIKMAENLSSVSGSEISGPLKLVTCNIGTNTHCVKSLNHLLFRNYAALHIFCSDPGYHPSTRHSYVA